MSSSGGATVSQLLQLQREVKDNKDKLDTAYSVGVSSCYCMAVILACMGREEPGMGKWKDKVSLSLEPCSQASAPGSQHS